MIYHQSIYYLEPISHNMRHVRYSSMPWYILTFQAHVSTFSVCCNRQFPPPGPLTLKTIPWLGAYYPWMRSFDGFQGWHYIDIIGPFKWKFSHSGVDRLAPNLPQGLFFFFFKVPLRDPHWPMRFFFPSLCIFRFIFILHSDWGEFSMMGGGIFFFFLFFCFSFLYFPHRFCMFCIFSEHPWILIHREHLHRYSPRQRPANYRIDKSTLD